YILLRLATGLSLLIRSMNPMPGSPDCHAFSMIRSITFLACKHNALPSSFLQDTDSSFLGSSNGPVYSVPFGLTKLYSPSSFQDVINSSVNFTVMLKLENGARQSRSFSTSFACSLLSPYFCK